MATDNFTGDTEKMPTERRPSPTQSLGDGASIWATQESRDLVFEIAAVEQRAVKVVLHRALLDYAERSEDFQKALRAQKRKKAAA